MNYATVQEGILEAGAKTAARAIELRTTSREEAAGGARTEAIRTSAEKGRTDEEMRDGLILATTIHRTKGGDASTADSTTAIFRRTFVCGARATNKMTRKRTTACTSKAAGNRGE
jgi:hypothetical protein